MKLNDKGQDVVILVYFVCLFFIIEKMRGGGYDEIYIYKIIFRDFF